MDDIARSHRQKTGVGNPP
ncbi:hypothetical protein D018_2742A, partial [Vibrio parahaemolyticus VP2007-007]